MAQFIFSFCQKRSLQHIFIFVNICFFTNSCSQMEFAPNLVYASLDDETAQISEISSLIKKYGEENFYSLNLSSFQNEKMKTHKSNIPEIVINEIYNGISNFDVGAKSLTSEHLIVRKRNELFSGSYQNYSEKHVYKFYSLNTNAVVIIDLSSDVAGLLDE